jgi:molybdopterin-dependent oxidoreductase alpha subunit
VRLPIAPPAWLTEHFPFGLLHPHKPRHILSIVETLRDNLDGWHNVWRVLNGPCNGCAVQTDGLRDNVLPNSPHFCSVRLSLIEEVLRRDFDPALFADVTKLRRLSNTRLERLGRIPVPLLRRHGECAFQVLSFEEAYDLAAEWIAKHRGDECGFFTTSKGINNEEYFVFQQFARVVGQTNNVDSCARQCHAASVAALKATLGVGASTGSLSDFMQADVLVLAGTNLANNQPLTVRYIEHGRRTRGGKPYIIVVNPYRERGLERYWVPSSPRSAVFGTKLCDQFVQVRTGGDVAFFNGVLKVLIEDGLLSARHQQFIGARTEGFEPLAASLRAQSCEQLECGSGVARQVMRDVARRLSASENILFVWGMGLTQHRTGTDNVKAVINLALALGQLGRPKAGLAALRGQSSVQAAGECGVAPNIFPGGVAVNAENAGRFGAWWSQVLSDQPGLATGPMLQAADAGKIKLLMCMGGNLHDTMPDRHYVRGALERLPYRIRLDVMMNREALIEPGEGLLILPVRNWYEWSSVFTTTSTDRTIRAFRGTLPAHRNLPESWQALVAIARRVLRGRSCEDPFSHAEPRESLTANAHPVICTYINTDDIRRDMSRAIPMYRGIETLDAPHKQMQWGGPFLFSDGFPAMPNGRARFSLLTPSHEPVPEGCFMVSSRRGWGQWNSQHLVRPKKDTFTGAQSRRAILMHPADAEQLGLARGDPIELHSRHATSYTGYCWPDEAQRPRHLQVFWPASNDLFPRGVYDSASMEPDYNVLVTVKTTR